MKTSESIKEISTALNKFQNEVEKIKKEAKNPFFKSNYASLANILDVIRDPLTTNGLSFIQMPQFDGTLNKNVLTTRLMHVSGEYFEGDYELNPTKQDPQSVGSAITYARRYALSSILGLNIDDDDDGNAASGKNTIEALKAELETLKKENEMLKSIKSSLVVELTFKAKADKGEWFDVRLENGLIGIVLDKNKTLKVGSTIVYTTESKKDKEGVEYTKINLLNEH